MFVPFTSSLRYTLPRNELRAHDRRTGAYPTKARTGDRTRSGKNKYFFDDTRTVVFSTGINVSLPTTFQTGSKHLSADFTSSFVVLGNTLASAIDQWIPHREQVENLGPFIEDKLFEQDEHAVVNSNFMTGVAYSIAPDRFKSRLSNKTIIRIQQNLTNVSRLTANSSSMHYLNPVSGGFDLVANETVNAYYNDMFGPSNDDYLAMLDPVLFTPYGYHYMPANGMVNDYDRGSQALPYISTINNYTGDGNDAATLIPNTWITLHSSSLVNPRHNANASQSIKLSSYLAHPFLLEKVVVEFPVEAGPGWMNDSFQVRSLTDSTLSTFAVDAGGPMVTVSILRQDKVNNFRRDLIASATFTNAFDSLTASYLESSAQYVFDASPRSVQGWTRTGVSNMVNVGATLSGPVISGSTNYFTGTVKVAMDPAVSHHIMRYKTSGSAAGIMRAGDQAQYSSYRNNPPALSTFGPFAKRPGVLQSGRSILGNHVTFLSKNQITSDMATYETDFDNVAWTNAAQKWKLYQDVAARVQKSPYLLYPEDELILCLSKHRAVVKSGSMNFLDNGLDSRIVSDVTAQHDIKIPIGNLKITLYGDLVREDREFHDTLNQRLETEELWETIGDDPVLDQFDTTYANELSGSYLDRFNIRNAVKYAFLEQALTSSLEINAYHSNFMQDTSLTPWSSQYSWSSSRYIYELKKSCRNVNHISTDDRFWDTRVPEPFDIMSLVNSNFRLEGYDAIPNTSGIFNNILYTGTTYNSGNADRGIRDWIMTYPYESKYNNVTKVFVDTIANIKRVYRTRAAGGGGPTTATPTSLTYGQLIMVVGDDAVARHLSSDGTFGGNGDGVTFSEFAKIFYGTGDGRSSTDNCHALFAKKTSDGVEHGAQIRGWRYGMMSAFPLYPGCTFRRDHFGQFRDMLEQRLDAKFYNEENNKGLAGVKEGPVQVRFYDRNGRFTDPLLTLTSNLSFEATSSMPYTDGVARNRPEIDFNNINITNVTI